MKYLSLSSKNRFIVFISNLFRDILITFQIMNTRLVLKKNSFCLFKQGFSLEATQHDEVELSFPWVVFVFLLLISLNGDLNFAFLLYLPPQNHLHIRLKIFAFVLESTSLASY